MNAIDLRAEVERAVRVSWPAFATEHPRLAEVLDEMLVVDAATASIADDAEYQETMAQALAMGLAGEAVGEIIVRFVGRWLKELL
ncbi:MAG: hypothetical protein ACREIT_05600 [Tepidisphaeraceae bacterium]